MEKSVEEPDVPRSRAGSQAAPPAVNDPLEADDLTFVELRCSAVLLRADEILLVRHVREGRSYWVLPGGHPRTGEIASAAVSREVEEETGLCVEPGRVLFVLEGLAANDRRILEVVFLVTASERAPAQHSPAEAACFFPLRALPRDLYPPIAGYLRGASQTDFRQSASYLGNMWRGTRSPGTNAGVDRHGATGGPT